MPGTFKEFVCWPLYKLVDLSERRRQAREKMILENGSTAFGTIIESKPDSYDRDPGYKYVIEFFTANGTRKLLKSARYFHWISDSTYEKYGRIYGIGTSVEVTYLPNRPSKNLHKVLPETAPNNKGCIPTSG
jgi:hypothetical protein